MTNMYGIALSHSSSESPDDLRTVLTVPAAFTPDQRAAVAKNAEGAGFNVVQGLNFVSKAFERKMFEEKTKKVCHKIHGVSSARGQGCVIVDFESSNVPDSARADKTWAESAWHDQRA